MPIAFESVRRGAGSFEAGNACDAVIVAGEEAASRRVLNRHKAFLKIHGKSTIQYVVETLQRVDGIRDIYIIGPGADMQAVFQAGGVDLNAPKKIHLLEQVGNLYENVWHAFNASLPEGFDDGRKDAAAHREKAVLIVPCDAPLITVREVEHFISHCDMARYDYVLGLTPEKRMEYFYPAAGRPGIRMSYLHMREKNYRINNLHMVKPVKVRNREHINRLYAYRYQKKMANILQLGLYVIRIDRFRSYRLLIGLQMALKCSEWNLMKLSRFFSRWAPKKALERAVSRLLNTRFASLEVPYPGAALDIDNDADFKSLQIMFDRWRRYLDALGDGCEN